MKKPKRSSPYGDQVDPMRDLNVDIDSTDEDDIIDLEDIIEMPDRPIDEDEDLDLGGGILDVDPDMEPEPEMAAQPPVKEKVRTMGPEEEDLVKLIEGEPDEDEVLFDPTASGGLAKPSTGGGEPQLFDEDEGSFLDEFIDKFPTPERGASAEGPANLKAMAAAALTINEETVIADVEPEPQISGEPVATAQALAGAPTIAATQSAADLSQTADELIGYIESRLQEHMRVMVESRLPDLVRSIIHEEIENLKKELGLTGEPIL